MKYQGYEEGLYLVAQKSATKGVDHYGVLDIGNRIQHPAVDGSNPVLIHQTPPGIKIDWFQDTGTWRVLGRVTDQPYALQRLQLALANPLYDLFGHNCEHFARFVVTGVSESTQLRAVAVVAGMAAVALVAARS